MRAPVGTVNQEQTQWPSWTSVNLFQLANQIGLRIRT